jgi:phosphotransferase system HPr-like phosphotransfer protein
MAINLPIISEWNPAGINKAINDFKKLETNGQKASFAIKKAAVPAGLALAALGAVAFDAVKAFAEDDAAAQKLATTLRNTTGATNSQISSVEDFITKTSIAAAVTDDELRPALDKLVRGTGDVTKAQKLLNLALNVSAGTGKDLGAVSDALSKAFNGNLGPLKKLDPALASLVANGATADEVFAALSKTFNNQASTAANTTQGRMKSLSIQMGEFKESVGAAVAPIIEKLLPAFTSLGNFTRDNTGLVVAFGAAFVVLATTVLAVNAAMKAYAAIQAIVTVATNVLTASTYALWIATGVAVIIAIIAALVALQVKFDIFGKTVNAVKTVFTQLWDVARFVFGAIKTGFETLKNLGASIFDGIGGAFKGVINAVISAMEKGLNFAIKGLNTILDGIDKAAGPWVNFGTIPDVKLPRLAEGGIVTSPTIAMIGERGPEAVIPLNRAGGMGMGNQITVNVSSADPNAVVAALQQYIRDRGALPISVNPTAFRG